MTIAERARLFHQADGESPIDEYFGSGHVRRQIAGKKRDHIGDLTRLTHPAERDGADQLLDLRNFGGTAAGLHIGLGRPRMHGVDADIIAFRRAVQRRDLG